MVKKVKYCGVLGIVSAFLLYGSVFAAEAEDGDVDVGEYEEYSRHVVRVFVLGVEGQGTGVVIAPGIVLTALHVVDMLFSRAYRVTDGDPKFAVAAREGRIFSASVLERKPDADMAFLRINDGDFGTLLPVQKFRKSRVLVGERVFGIGHRIKLSYTYFWGRVSAVRYIDSPWFTRSGWFFQIDATVDNGDSGGPVFDARGRLLGIVLSRLGTSETAFVVPLWESCEAKSVPAHVRRILECKQ